MTEPAKLLGLFLALIVGGVGLPIPEDITLVGAGVLADQHLLRLRDAIVVGLIGVIAADWIIYLFGRRYGAGLAAHPRLARILGAHRVEAVRGAVLRHGARAVFLARFMFGFRIATFLSAGTFGVSAPRFALAEAAGSAVFVPAMVTLGFLFAHQATRVVENVSRVEHWIMLVGLLGLALFIALRAWAARELAPAEAPTDQDATAPDAPPPRPDPDPR
jgi:membrane protein DedA with SNARE-associated domain